MKKALIIPALVALGMTAQAQAQVVTSPAGTAVQASDEVMNLSAELKAAYGILSQDLAHLGREIGPDASKATPEQAAMRERMKTALLQLEGMLSTVNGPDAAKQWDDVKAKAAMVRANALSIVEERKATR